VAQLKALDAVEFSLIALSNAHELLRQREHEISLIREGLSERFYFSA
jgi:hypothetical protein